MSDGIFAGVLAFPPNATADSLPALSLGLGDQVYDIPSSQYLVPKTVYPALNLTGNLTYSWIASAGPGSFMLGQKWLEGIYTAYDMEGQRKILHSELKRLTLTQKVLPGVGFAHLK